MYDDFLSYYYEGISPAYQDYVEASRQENAKDSFLRKPALNFINLLYHYRGELQKTFPNEKLYRNIIADQCPDYDILGDVWNATKHVVFDNKRRTPLIKDKSSVYEALICTVVPNDDSIYLFTQWWIVVKLLTGEERDLFDMAINVLNLWTNWLYARGHIAQNPVFRYNGNDIKTKEESDKERVSFTKTTPGKAKLFLVRYRRYIPETNSFTPFQSHGNFD